MNIKLLTDMPEQFIVTTATGTIQQGGFTDYEAARAWAVNRAPVMRCSPDDMRIFKYTKALQEITE